MIKLKFITQITLILFPCRNGIKRSVFRGLFFALSASVVLCVYSAGCVLAAYLVTNNRASVGDVLRYESNNKYYNKLILLGLLFAIVYLKALCQDISANCCYFSDT